MSDQGDEASTTEPRGGDEFPDPDTPPTDRAPADGSPARGKGTFDEAYREAGSEVSGSGS